MTQPIRKQFEIKVIDRRKDGGRIIINTASVDRDSDRVYPAGAQIDNYLKNPIVQFGHNYRDPWATIGRTNKLEISPDTITADFTLRPAANDQDPQTIVRLLWDGGWIKTASIGFIPKAGTQNSFGGMDFTEWELLEWSIVAVPANQDAVAQNGNLPEVVRLALKTLDETRGATQLSAGQAQQMKQLFTVQEAREAAVAAASDPATQPDQPLSRAWIRRLQVETDKSTQTVFACFHRWSVDVPEDAQMLQWNEDAGECEWVPDPNAGKTVTLKEVAYVPPIELSGDAIYSCGGPETADDELVRAFPDEFEVKDLSEILLALPVEKSWKQYHAGVGVNLVTAKGLQRAKELSARLSKRRKQMDMGQMRDHLDGMDSDMTSMRDHMQAMRQMMDNAGKGVEPQTKRGRVLSAANEQKITEARDNLNDVLAQLEQEPVQDAADTVEKAALPVHHTPTDDTGGWDGPATEARIPNDAGEATLRKFFAWVDPQGNADTKAAYKFGHHDVSAGGEVGAANSRGCIAGIAVLNGGRGGTTIPDADSEGVWKHLAAHLQDAGREPPPLKSAEELQVEQVLFDGLKQLTTLVKEVVS